MPKIVDHDARREAIAECAVRAVAQYGLDRVKLEHVAGFAGCTTGSLMHFYPSKRAILEAALQHVATRLAQRYAAARDATDLVDSLAGVLPLDETRQREWRVWVSYFGIAGFQTRLREAHHDFYDENRGWVRDILEDAVARGEIRPGLPLTDVADQIVALTDGIGVRATMDPDAWGASQQRALMASFVELLRPQGVRESRTQTKPRPRPSEAFARHFGPQHGVEPPPRRGHGPRSPADEDNG